MKYKSSISRDKSKVLAIFVLKSYDADKKKSNGKRRVMVNGLTEEQQGFYPGEEE